MVHWLWIPIVFMIGMVVGMMAFAVFDEAKKADEGGKRRWWDE